MHSRLPAGLVVAIGVGGMIGTLLRTAIGAMLSAHGWSTLVANLIGAAVLGVLVGWDPFRAAPVRPSRVQAFFTTGVLGGFTTYSALALETITLPGWSGPAYAMITLVFGVGAATAGIQLGRALRDQGGANA